MPILIEDEFEGDEVLDLGALAPREAARVQAELERHRQDALWLDAHRDELLATHPERWVAVFEGRVVAIAEEFGELLEQIDARGVPRGCFVHEYLTAEDVDLILLCA